MPTPTIIFEDEQLLVIDKPSGLVVNRADTTAKIETVQDWIESRKSDESENLIIRQSEDQTNRNSEFSDRAGIVHRLDKDTSGLLVIAKTPEAFENLKNQFKSREVTKKYLCLVHDKVEPASGSIDAPISRNPFNRMHFGVFPGGREAETDYKTICHAGLDPASIQIDSGLRRNDKVFTLLEVSPHTGRTHQIRVHMKYIGHPIVSDPLYVGRKQLRDDLKFCPRLFLHATTLTLKHPQTNENLKFESPLSSDLQNILEKLTKVS